MPPWSRNHYFIQNCLIKNISIRLVSTSTLFIVTPRTEHVSLRCNLLLEKIWHMRLQAGKVRIQTTFNTKKFATKSKFLPIM